MYTAFMYQDANGVTYQARTHEDDFPFLYKDGAV
jgi:hypothetical protein